MSRQSTYRPVIHQAEPSLSSGYTRSSYYTTSSSGSSTPRSSRSSYYYDEKIAREYGAEGHAMNVCTRKDVVVINRHQSGYDHGAPTPRHDSWASREREKSSKSKSKK